MQDPGSAHKSLFEQVGVAVFREDKAPSARQFPVYSTLAYKEVIAHRTEHWQQIDVPR